MTDKPFKSIDDQLKILTEERNLNIINVSAAKDALQSYGYYEIINGYKDPFLINPDNDDEGYKDNSNFEHIFSLFELDRDIRDTVLKSLVEFELIFKQALAYSIANLISDSNTIYTEASHYNAGNTLYHDQHGNTVTDRTKLLNKINKLLHSSNQPFKHYRENHGNVPPWIIVKGLTFGESIFLYRLSNPDVRLSTISIMTGLDTGMIELSDSVLEIKQAFSDLLLLYLDYRNLTAHGGRVYNHNARRNRIRHYSSFIYRETIIPLTNTQFQKGVMRGSVGTVLKTLNIFDNTNPSNSLYSWLKVYLDQYLKKYPEDEELLLTAMELENDFMK